MQRRKRFFVFGPWLANHIPSEETLLSPSWPKWCRWFLPRCFSCEFIVVVPVNSMSTHRTMKYLKSLDSRKKQRRTSHTSFLCSCQSARSRSIVVDASTLVPSVKSPQLRRSRARNNPPSSHMMTLSFLRIAIRILCCSA